MSRFSVKEKAKEARRELQRSEPKWDQAFAELYSELVLDLKQFNKACIEERIQMLSDLSELDPLPEN